MITHVLRSTEKSHHYSAGVNGTSCTLGNQGDLVPIWGWVSCGVSHDTMHGSGEMSESMSCDIVLGEGGGGG